jgi:hypothetical protein
MMKPMHGDTRWMVRYEISGRELSREVIISAGMTHTEEITARNVRCIISQSTQFRTAAEMRSFKILSYTLLWTY